MDRPGPGLAGKAPGKQVVPSGESHMLRFLTAGESHGPALTGILEGMPAGLTVDEDAINDDLRRRQGGYGRSGRQVIEKDRVEFLGGVENGRTTGAPIAIRIANRDFANHQKREK